MVYQYSQFNKAKMLSELDSGDGYVLFQLEPVELELLRKLITEQYLHAIQMHCPEKVAQFKMHPPSMYHKIYSQRDFEHAMVWRKPTRVLGPTAVAKVMEMPLFSCLKKVFNCGGVSDEEGFGWPGIYWRLVRPGNSDIGPMHADSWFWGLGHGKMPEGFFRVKIWIAIWTESDKSGLQVVPGSQLRQWQYHGEERGGILKPVLDSDLTDENITALPLDSGQAVLFHDDLIHGGMPNKGELTRVSIEFTLLVPEETRL